MYLGPMPLVITPAIILHAFRYADTSKIVRLATREHGVQSAIAKGASRPKSRFGASLQVLTAGVAHLYLRATTDLQTLSAFDVTEQHPGLATDLERYAAASVLAEVMLGCAPAEPHAELALGLALREGSRFAEASAVLGRVLPRLEDPALTEMARFERAQPLDEREHVRAVAAERVRFAIDARFDRRHRYSSTFGVRAR